MRKWASGDRKTVWVKKFSKRRPDGSVATWMVEKVSVLHPTTQQVVKIKRGQLSVMEVYPANVTFYNRKTMQIAPKRTAYYVFSQSFHGGPGSSRDALGGFYTGDYAEVFEEAYKENMSFLKREGFKVQG